MVNVALPAIENDVGGGRSGQQWVANFYLLALGSLILVGGSLADIYGERRMFSLGHLRRWWRTTRQSSGQPRRRVSLR